MNADGRRWICRSLVLSLLGAGFATPAWCEEFQSQLGAEIERQFEKSAIEVDDAPLEFGCKFSKYIASGPALRTFKTGGWALISTSKGSSRLDEAAKLPQPTLVEAYIAKGFPTGESADKGNIREEDYSYYLAEEEITFGGLGYSR